ncbi:hypothetical protein A4H97_07210 [Niastella yeongjuensis]|uniref:Lipoprotein n=1 Tax=Niastella yeongjuensis TaxID=354355 RepID=A0A1V9EMX2_9BACT|nr:hypothetical protein [Niastella yeongjuensis]OQP47284.1 hypothetical protein A4H97_07210 [Niastella yeongjuensis]SEN77122.1 hypothetical protein SAMN05660816_01466 [Niastella yeongjuensis]
MKKLFFLAGLVTLFSCDQPKPIRSKGGTPYNGRFKDLFAQFFNMGLDTLEVHSPDTTTSVFNGRIIDSVSAQLFPAEMAQHHTSENPELFAIYKFMLDSARMGLLARTPSEYEPSSIKLFLWDKRKDSLTSYMELGETWGDAGDYLYKKSWLFRDTSSRHIQALIEVFQGQDNSVDNPKDTTRDERYLYTLIDFAKNGLDTIFMDEEKLPAKYSVLIKKKGPR